MIFYKKNDIIYIQKRDNNYTIKAVRRGALRTEFRKMHKVAKFSIENLVQYNNNKNPKKLKFSLDNTPPICYNTDTLKRYLFTLGNACFKVS